MQYPKAPIVEAVLELRFERQLETKLIEKVAAKFASDYPHVEDQVSFKIEVTIGATTSRQVPEWTGKKLSSTDQVNVVGIRSNSFACMRLAPYTGWEGFEARAKEGWSRLMAVLGRIQVTRIGLRYINRIDIPAGGPVDLDDYLTIGPRLPDLAWGSINNYVLQVVRPLSEEGCLVTINSGTTLAPLLDHVSVLLDIDVAANGLSLMRDDDIWSLASRLREQKNLVFEGCITDKARGLFAK